MVSLKIKCTRPGAIEILRHDVSPQAEIKHGPRGLVRGRPPGRPIRYKPPVITPW